MRPFRSVEVLPEEAEPALLARPAALFADGAFPEDPEEAARLVREGTLSSQTRLSDHLALVSPRTAVGRALTFNVLTRCRHGPFGLNNGFGANEGRAAYEERLSRVAARLERLLTADVTLVALQEGPDEASPAGARLLSALDRATWHVRVQRTARASFRLWSAARRDRFEPRETRVSSPLDPQCGRVLAWTLEAAGVGAMTFANLHLEWADDAHEALDALLAPPRAMLAGDFNRPPDHPLRRLDALAVAADATLHFPDRPTALGYARGGTASLGRIDGFVTRGL